MAFARRRRRRRGDGAVEPEIAAGPPLESRSFFKIILSDTLESGKLGIPKSFLRRCGKDLSNSVLLQVPGGSTWTIELEKRNDGMVLLWKGWQEFAEYYSIGHGHLIVFKYKGNSTFCVIIFNKSASEIDYPLCRGETSYLGSKFPSPKTEDVMESEDPEDLAPYRRMRVKSHLPYSQLSAVYSPRGSKDAIRQSGCKVNPSEPVFGGPTRIGPRSGFELTSKFESEYPFFVVMMQPSYLKHHILYVPRRFIMQHIRKIKEIATLRHSGRSWIVKLRSCGHRGARFASGWFAFMREAHLHLGNVCVFELIDGDDIVFRVYIFNGAGRNKQSKCTASLSERVFNGSTPLRPLTTPELANESYSEHPFFKLVIPGYQVRKMNVPVGFTRKHIQESTDMVTLRYSDRSWPVKVLRYKEDHRAFFSGGWPAFARENCLRAGDVCMFNLIDREDSVFKVSIFRSAARIDTDLEEPDLSQAQSDLTDRIQQSTCKASHLELVLHGPTLPMPLTFPELARKFDSEHPFFKILIRQSYIRCLSIPVGFAKQHIQENKGMATLRFSGKSWPVKLLIYTQTRKRRKLLCFTRETRVFFSTGWPAFARDTHLHVGNICAFELINRDDAVFQVSIFPSASRIKQSTCRSCRSALDFHGPAIPRSLITPELASNIDTEHPFFKVVIPRSYMSCLGVPVGFAQQHLQENKRIATLWYSDRSWPVKLIRIHGRARATPCTFFSAGWCAFARETHLCAGNVCVFELIDRDDTVFTVSISSGADNDPIHVD